ncbi:MAG: hypothetical protein ACXW5U_16745 [Thermoanaerobaculia bacterium]
MAIAPAGRAENFLGLQIHGFGGWYYGQSSDVQFLEANTDGSTENAQFALNVTAQPWSRLKIVSQGNFEQRGGENTVELDYAFADLELASRLWIRGGRVKHPWGIYGEIYDVGTARPFQHLSQAIYGPVGFTGKAYEGVGITGFVGGGTSPWELQYDVYGGEVDTAYEESGMFSLLPGAGTQPQITQKYTLRADNKDVIGTRIRVNTPVEGLWFGGSAYKGTENISGMAERDAQAYLGSAEYANTRIIIRAEAARINADKEVDQSAMYGEAAFRITPKWQIAARWDKLHRDLHSMKNLPVQVPPFITARYDVSHTEKVVGLNYWFKPNIVIRAGYSKVEGDALLYPTAAELGAFIMAGVPIKKDTNVLLLGTHFSF